jgi:hypothetical protein
VCEVEIDPETGMVEVARYTSVDDVGRAINPLLIHGQTHGGIAQGVGEALWERCLYERETGQLQSATFMEYAMPRADMLPSFTSEISEVPSTSNPLGLRVAARGNDPGSRQRGQCRGGRAGRSGRRARRATRDARARVECEFGPPACRRDPSQDPN